MSSSIRSSAAGSIRSSPAPNGHKPTAVPRDFSPGNPVRQSAAHSNRWSASPPAVGGLSSGWARAAAALDPRGSELGLLLETAAVVAGMYDPVTTPSVALRRAALRDRAASDLAAPPELVAAASQISALMNEPAEVCAELATRALQAGGSAPSGSNGRPWFLRNMVFAATLTLLWAERYAQVRPLLDASIAQARATGDSARLALGLANRGWLALRRGDLHAAEGDARTALAATGLPAPPIYRVINLGVLVRVLL